MPESINRYDYVTNNPVLVTDPSGLARILPCKARGGGIKGDAGTASQFTLDPCAMPPFLLAASGGGPQSVLAYVGFGILQAASRPASTAMGRAIDSLKSYISTGQGAWRLFSVHLEEATSDVYKKLGAEFSMEQVFTNTETGERIVRHIVYSADKVFEETFRDIAKFGAP